VVSSDFLSGQRFASRILPRTAIFLIRHAVPLFKTKRGALRTGETTWHLGLDESAGGHLIACFSPWQICQLEEFGRFGRLFVSSYGKL
jgi:hypothetical protein